MEEEFIMTSLIYVLCILEFVGLISKRVLIVLMAPEMIINAMMVNLKVVVTPAIIDIFIENDLYSNRLLISIFKP